MSATASSQAPAATADGEPVVIASVPTSIVEAVKNLDPSSSSFSSCTTLGAGTPTDQAATAATDGDGTNQNEKKRSSFSSPFGRAYQKLKFHQSGRDKTFVRMRRSDYEKYWARNDKGEYAGTEPEGCEAALECLRRALDDEKMQALGKKDVEREVVEGWKPLKERSGWTHTNVGYAMSGMGGGGGM